MKEDPRFVVILTAVGKSIGVDINFKEPSDYARADLHLVQQKVVESVGAILDEHTEETEFKWRVDGFLSWVESQGGTYELIDPLAWDAASPDEKVPVKGIGHVHMGEGRMTVQEGMAKFLGNGVDSRAQRKDLYPWRYAENMVRALMSPKRNPRQVTRELAKIFKHTPVEGAARLADHWLTNGLSEVLTDAASQKPSPN